MTELRGSFCRENFGSGQTPGHAVTSGLVSVGARGDSALGMDHSFVTAWGKVGWMLEGSPLR